MQPLKGQEGRPNLGAIDGNGASQVRPKRRPDLRVRVVEGETLVLDRQEEFVHQFNKTASYIWERCNGRQTTDEITEELCQAFQVDFATARRDVLATVARLRHAKLLENF